MQGHKIVRYAGGLMAVLLLAFLYPISVGNWFSETAIYLLYSVMFGVSVRLILFGKNPLTGRIVWSILLSVAACAALIAMSYLIMIIRRSPYPEGGVVGLLLIYGFYLGLPILVTSVGLSLLSFPIERRG